MPRRTARRPPAPEWVVLRTLVAVDKASGRPLRLLLRLGRPQGMGPGAGGRCALRLEGALRDDLVLQGADPLHALELALKFAESRLRLAHHLDLFWPDGEPYRALPGGALDGPDTGFAVGP